MASTVCVSRCRLLAKLEINRGLCVSPIFRDISNNRESWCRRWRPARRSFFTSVCAHGSKSPSKVDHEQSDGASIPTEKDRCPEAIMPRKYIRKVGAPARAQWSQESLVAALNDMSKGNLGVNQISRLYGIPSRTLRRRFANKKDEKKTLGKHPLLDFENEKRLVMHIQKLEKAGFPPTRDMIRKLAFEFAEKLGIEHPFDKETRKAGPHWLRSFLERNPQLSIRQAEGLSLARAQGLNREEVNKMFDLLLNVLIENDLLDKPDRIYNMDETGVQLNNSTGKVIASKGVRAVHSITSGEKGETMSVIACCNGVGNFLPPVVIIKGVNKKPEFQDGLPPGAEVYMNRKSAYVNAELFHKWLKEHFVPKKPQGKVLLILDGHSSHTNAIDMLETAEENGVILFCLPSHSTQALQPLDRSFFKPFKTFYAAETRNWVASHKERKISRLVAGKLIGSAWTRAATTSNAVSGFRACGIYPFNPVAIPDSFFAISDASAVNNTNQNQEAPEQVPPSNAPTNLTGDQNMPDINTDSVTENQHTPSNTDSVTENQLTQQPEPGPSNVSIEEADSNETRIVFDRRLSNSSPSVLTQNNNVLNIIDIDEKETPSKYLQECSPVPIIPIPLYKRGKQSAAILNSKENIENKKMKAKGKATPGIPCKNRRRLTETDTQGKKKTSGKGKKRPRKISSSDDTDCDSDVSNEVSSNKASEENDVSQKKRAKGKATANIPCKNRRRLAENDIQGKKKTSGKNKKMTRKISSSDDSDSVISKEISDISDSNNSECTECFEEYGKTKSTVDWIQCVMCKQWLHENCTMYGDYCNRCGRTKRINLKK